MVTGGNGFVRAAEWHRIREFVTGIPGRAEPGVLAVTGEAGAGKSTLWRAGLTAATGAGCQVLRSEPSATEADASFGGLSDLLSARLPEVAASIPEPQLEALEVALLLRPAGGTPPTAHAVHRAVLSALRCCLGQGPVLIGIDDVQWLDAGSLEALMFALRRITSGPLAMLLAARAEAPGDPLTIGAPDLPHGWYDLRASMMRAERIELAPLDEGQIQDLLPWSATAAQVRLVTAQSRGNPFWAREIAASLPAAGATASVPVPPLALTLTGRLSRSLTPAAADALAVVAAAGRITVSDAIAVLGHLADPAAAIDAAVLAGVVAEAEGRVAPAHPLVGAAVLEALPPGRRLDIYQRLADTAVSPERHAHFAALAAEPGPDPCVAGALEAAAEAAHARGANAAAAQFAERAVTFTPEPDGADLVRRRIRAGELLFLDGHLNRSLQHLDRLDAGQLDPPDLEHALPLLVDMADLVRGADAATRIVTYAMETAGTDPRRRALVLALASDPEYGIRHRRWAAAAEAISCAGLAGAAANPTLHRALLNLVAAKVRGAEGVDAELLDRAEQLEAELPASPLHDTADLYRGLWARATDNLDGARAALNRCVARAREAGEEWALAMFLSYLATTEEMAGDYRAAREALAASDAIARWHDWPQLHGFVEPRCELLISAGQLDEAFSLAERHLPDREGGRLAARLLGECVRGKVSMWRGDATAAAGHLGRALRYAEDSDLIDPGVRSRLDPWLAEAYVATGRPGDAAGIASRLRETGARLNRPALAGDAARIDALCAAAAGDLDAAAAAAQAATEAHGRSPLKTELARSLLVLGRIERRRKARRQAGDALRRAQDLAAGMGHRPLLDEIARELPRLVSGRGGDELTSAEQRVASQIAAGATSQEAAATLFISVRTVESHVASMYRKLGVHSRSELRRVLLTRPPGSSGTG